SSKRHRDRRPQKHSMLASLILTLALWLTPAQDGAAVRQSEADFARGVALQQQGDLEGARAAYEAALKSVPRRFDALSNLGVVYARLGRYEQAIKCYRAALAVEPQQWAVRLNLGIAYYQTEQFAAAAEELARVTGAQTDNQ